MHEKFIIGFSTSHGESIYHGEYIENFNRFITFFEESYCDCENIEESLSESILKQYDAVIIGGPTRLFDDEELLSIRRYISDGGRVFILLKFGGDRILGTNIGKLFDDVKPRDDEF